MDKKILERASYDLKNEELEQAIADYTASNNDVRKLEGLIKIFRESQVLVPVAFPKQVVFGYANPYRMLGLCQQIADIQGETLTINVPFPEVFYYKM